MFDSKQKKLREYYARLNRALDYIYKNIDKALSLEDVADAAGFSPFHFHRIFRAMVAETLNDYIKRIRLERAANTLVHNPFRTITEAALDCGFSSSSNFARAFKEHFGVSASQWREGGYVEFRKNRKPLGNNLQPQSKPGKESQSESGYNSRAKPSERKEHEMKVEVKKMPPLRIAYVRHLRGYLDPGLKEAWEKICRWAGARKLIGPSTRFIGISYDDPGVTPEDKCRYDACLSVPEGVKPEGDVGIAELAGGNYAVLRFQGKADDIKAAYDFIYGKWMPQNGYQPADSLCYEIYHKEPDAEGNFLFDICVPVIPL